MKQAEFKEKVADLGLVLEDEQLAKFDQYAKLLIEWNQKMNLTSIAEPEMIYLKHFYDSLLSIKEIDYQGSLADVGSGAGFPGLVLKIAYPDLSVSLIEPIKKRCTFLNEVIKALDLEKIEVLNIRSEVLDKKKRETYDIVTARAVASLNILSELCAPLVKVGGYFVALKGPMAKTEASEAQKALKKLGLSLDKYVETVLDDANQRTLILLKKIKACPKIYPRDYALIKRKPL